MSQPYDDGFSPAGRTRPPRDMSRAPHRGQTIMVLGILSLVMGGIVLGPIAWIMGRSDLAEMDAGRMDRSGRDNTNTGRVCGMIATLLHGTGLAVGLFCCLGYFMFMGAMFSAAVGSSAKMQAQSQKAFADAQQRQEVAFKEAKEFQDKMHKEAREQQEKARRDKKKGPLDDPIADPNPNVDPKPEVQPVPNALAQPPAPAGVEGKTTVDLIPLIDPRQDAIKGKWIVVDNVLHCNDRSLKSCLQIPYQPPEEYDYTVVFSQPNLRLGVSAILPNPQGDSFFLEVGGRLRMFHLSAKPTRRTRLAQEIVANTAYTMVVEVRRDHVRCLLDGKELVRHATDFKDLTNDNWHKLTNPRLLGVGCDDPTVFHYLRVVEISGPGKRAR
jgi:hypothetical protein